MLCAARVSASLRRGKEGESRTFVGEKREKRKQATKFCNSAQAMLRLSTTGNSYLLTYLLTYLLILLILLILLLTSSPVQPPIRPPCASISASTDERTSSHNHRQFRDRGSRTHSITTVPLRPRHPRRQGAHPHSPRLGHRPETQGRQCRRRSDSRCNYRAWVARVHPPRQPVRPYSACHRLGHRRRAYYGKDGGNLQEEPKKRIPANYKTQA